MVTEAASSQNAAAGDAGRGYVGRIPVRNLWVLMLYASNLFRMRGRDDLACEDNPDELPNLVAEILTHAVEKRQRRQLSLGYRRRNAVINRVRGRIDVLTTARRQLLSRGRVACRFDELTIDTARNRFVRAALEKIARLAAEGEIAHRCRKLAYEFKTMGVGGLPPSPAELRSDHFGRHDADDRFMVAAAQLAFELALPTEEFGTNVLPLPDREEGWVRRLFDRAIGGFYEVTLNRQGWRVTTGKKFDWQIERRTPKVDSILPTMRTDIVLEHNDSRRRIVIDTKFTSILTSGWYRGRDPPQRLSLSNLRLPPLPGRPGRLDCGSSRRSTTAPVRRRDGRRNGRDSRTSHSICDRGLGSFERDDSPTTPERRQTVPQQSRHRGPGGPLRGGFSARRVGCVLALRHSLKSWPHRRSARMSAP